MNVILTDGTKNSIPLSDIKKITVSNISSDMSDNVNVQNIIKNLKLFQNYPNPFNPTTTIEYQISKAGEVEIHIFNISGQFVRKLSAQHQQAGNYRAIWDGNNANGKTVASGLYIYHVTFDNTIRSKRMILIK